MWWLRVDKALDEDFLALRCEYLTRALSIFVKTLGPDHPHSKLVRGNLEGW
jgi:hypothetical protein